MSEESEAVDSDVDAIMGEFLDGESEQMEDKESASSEPENNESEEGSKAEEPGEENRSESDLKLEALEKRIARQTAANKTLQEKYDEQLDILRNLQSNGENNNDDAPKEDDFDNYHDYLKALGIYKGRKAFEAEQARQKQELQEKEQIKKQQEQATAFERAEDQIRKELSDYDDVIENLNHAFLDSEPTSATIAVAQAITELSDPKLAYLLAKNEKLLNEIPDMTPMKALREVLLLNTHNASESLPKQKSKPISPVNSGGDLAIGAQLADRPADDLLVWGQPI